MSGVPPSGTDYHDVPTMQPTYSRHQSPRKKRTLSDSSYHGLTVSDNDSSKVNFYNIQPDSNATNKQYKLPTDEHHDNIDLQRRNHLNSISELFYQNSPHAYGSPLTKDRNAWMSSRRTTGWKMTMETARPLDFSETLEPMNNYGHPSLPMEDKTIKRQRTFDLFSLERSTTDGSWVSTMTPLDLGSSQPQLENQEQEQAYSTPLTESNDTQNAKDLPLKSTHHIRRPHQSPSPSIDNTGPQLQFTKTNKSLSASVDNLHPLKDSRSNKIQNNTYLSTKSAIQVDHAPNQKTNDDGHIDTKSTIQRTVHEPYSKENIDHRHQQLEPDVLEKQHELKSDLQHQPVQQNDITEAQIHLDLEQQLHSKHAHQQSSQDQHISQNPGRHHTTEQTLLKPNTHQRNQKQEYPPSEKPDHNHRSYQNGTMKDERGNTETSSTPADNGNIKVEQQHAKNKQLQQEMDALTESVKKLRTHYRLLNKVGCGAFSSVYKAQDILYDSYDNTVWEGAPISKSPSKLLDSSGKDRELSTTPSQQKYVALKQIYSTSSPKRMAHEIKILKYLRGAPYICQLITAFRSNDYVFLVMPYFKHYEFQDYCRDMNLVDTKYYMTALLTALNYLHHHRILHRDIKPNNFLYNKQQKTGMLIDFGLAQMESETKPPEPPRSNPTKPTSTTTLFRQRSFIGTPSTSSPSRSLRSPASKSTNDLNEDAPKKPGYIKHDQRKSIRASRAGTRGFRAPEVLLRVTHQTVAIDIWSVGVILLSLLSGRYPFFIAHGESDSLIEIASIFGMTEMKDCAALHNRTFETNIETIPVFRESLSKLCQALNSQKFKLWAKDDNQKVDYAIDLLEKMLTLNYKARITAKDALKHPFFI